MRIIAGLFLVATVALAHAADRDVYFKKGIELFKKQDYTNALTAFERAQQASTKNPGLYYNIAVCHYKLGHYDKAETFFKKTTHFKSFRQLANYNLGLIALKQDQEETAKWRFQRAAVAGGNKKINRLARHQLSLLKPEGKIQPGLTGFSSISLAVGYDDNVSLQTDTTPTLQTDHYTELFFQQPFAKHYSLDGSVHRLDYFDIESGDFNQLKIGVSRDFTLAQWELTPHAQLAQSSISSGSFQRQLDLKLSAKKYLTEHSVLRMRYRYTKIDSLDSNYDYLQGHRHQLRIGHRQPSALGRLRLRYLLEFNDRQDSATKNYSPTRHAWRAQLKQDNVAGWAIKEELRYRISHYGTVASSERKDKRLQLKLGAVKSLDAQWSLGILYNFTDNNSNQAIESYQRNDLQIYTNFDF